MKTIQKLQIELKNIDEINEKQKRGEISPLKSQIYREAIREKIFNILDTLEYLQGK